MGEHGSAAEALDRRGSEAARVARMAALRRPGVAFVAPRAPRTPRVLGDTVCLRLRRPPLGDPGEEQLVVEDD